VRLIFLLLLAVCVLADPALAHHAMGRELPSTFAQGLLSGLGHPVIGLDHLAALVAIGCLASLSGRGAVLVLGFVVMTAIGAALHLQQLTLPGSEMLVAISVIVLGAALIPARFAGSRITLVLFALAGFLHGYALAESIVGAERTPLVAYLIGLVAIQTALGLAIMLAARLVAAKSSALPLRLAGACIAGIGIALVVGQASGGA